MLVIFNYYWGCRLSTGLVYDKTTEGLTALLTQMTFSDHVLLFWHRFKGDFTCGPGFFQKTLLQCFIPCFELRFVIKKEKLPVIGGWL